MRLPTRVLQREKFGFLVWKGGSSWGLGAGEPTAALRPPPALLAWPPVLCLDVESGGPCPAALLKVRRWGGSSWRCEEQLSEGTAAVGSYPQQMETYHTLC